MRSVMSGPAFVFCCALVACADATNDTDDSMGGSPSTGGSASGGAAGSGGGSAGSPGAGKGGGSNAGSSNGGGAGSSSGGGAGGASAGSGGTGTAGMAGKAGGGAGGQAGGGSGGGGAGGAPPVVCASTSPDVSCTCAKRDADEYWFCTTFTGFTAAEGKCTAAGMHLPKVDSQAEDTWLYTTATAKALGEYYLGATDASTPDTWTWLAGGQFWQGVADGTPTGFVNWNTAEPNASGDCLVVQNGGVWDDRGCGDERKYICEAP